MRCASFNALGFTSRCAALRCFLGRAWPARAESSFLVFHWRHAAREAGRLVAEGRRRERQKDAEIEAARAAAAQAQEDAAAARNER